MKRSSQFGCKSCHVSHPAFAGVRCGRESVASRSFGEEFRGERTPSSSAVDKREGEFSRAENETRGDEKEREGGGKKSRKEGNTDKRLLKRNYAGRTRAKKRSNK